MKMVKISLKKKKLKPVLMVLATDNILKLIEVWCNIKYRYFFRYSKANFVL